SSDHRVKILQAERGWFQVVASVCDASATARRLKSGPAALIERRYGYAANLLGDFKRSGRIAQTTLHEALRSFSRQTRPAFRNGTCRRSGLPVKSREVSRSRCGKWPTMTMSSV